MSTRFVKESSSSLLVHCVPLGALCTLRCVGITLIDRANRLTHGAVAEGIARMAAEGASHRYIASELADVFGLDVSHTTVGRYLKAQAAK